MQIIQMIHKDNSDYIIAKGFYQIPVQDCIHLPKLEKNLPFMLWCILEVKSQWISEWRAFLGGCH